MHRLLVETTFRLKAVASYIALHNGTKRKAKSSIWKLWCKYKYKTETAVLKALLWWTPLYNTVKNERVLRKAKRNKWFQNSSLCNDCIMLTFRVPANPVKKWAKGDCFKFSKSTKMAKYAIVVYAPLSTTIYTHITFYLQIKQIITFLFSLSKYVLIR